MCMSVGINQTLHIISKIKTVDIEEPMFHDDIISHHLSNDVILRLHIDHHVISTS